MAGDWIKIEIATPDKPEVVRMADILGIDQDSVTGKLVRLWGWADTNSVDGNALSVTHAFIDRYTNCNGFATALQQVGWLNAEGDHLSIPNFQRHNGKSAKSRASAARRVADHRTRNGSVTVEALQKALLEERKRREELLRERAKGGFPTLEEVKEYGITIMAPPECSEAFWNAKEGDGWADRNGNTLRDWRGPFRNWVTKWKAHQHLEKAKGANGAAKDARGQKPGEIPTDETLDKVRMI